MAEKVIILGGGPAGLSAAIYTAREGFTPLVVSGFKAGGQLMLTTTVENFPGFPKGVEGPDIVRLMREQAERFGARFIDDDATEVDLSKKPFKVVVASKNYEADSLIIATGANSKMLGLESEKKLVGRGVSTCGTCDGPLFKNKDVVVVGGGDTAMEDSLFIAKFAKSVTIVHRRDKFKASKIMQERVLSNPKIRVLWNNEVVEILGKEKVTGIRLRDTAANKTQEIPIDGVFIAIGYSPNTELFRGQLKTDDIGYLVTRDEVLTDVEGIFVAGDVSDRFYRQAATASGSGVKAALHVREYLSMLYYTKNRN